NAGFRLGKYAIKNGATNNLDNDYPMFRYADVLMMKAEALLRTGRENEATVLVSQVRERAFKTTPEKTTVNGGDLLKGSGYNYGWQEKDGTGNGTNGGANIPFGRFFDELGSEYTGEAHRRLDIIRFWLFQTKAWFKHRPHAKAQTRTLFTIPNDVTNKSPNLDQNPGHEE